MASRRGASSARRSAKAQRRNQRSDLGARVLAAIPAIAVALFLVITGGIVFTAGLIVLGLICLHELYEMFERAHPAKLAGFAGMIGMLLAAYYGDQYQLLLALALALPLTFLVAAGQPRGGAASIAVTMLGLAWVGVALAHAVMLRELPHGEGIIITILVGTFLGDTGAYLGGRAFGSQKLAPRISPNKTVEGLAIGFLVCVVAVWFAHLYQDDYLSGTDSLVLGAAVGLAAPIGDLFESYLKRDAGTKDTGSLFGAHGGALDRLDAVFFTAVTGYFVWVAML